MKWRLRRMIDKCILFLVGIKPIRWFFDQLFKFGCWAKSKPWLHAMWKWYCLLIKPFWVIYGSYSALYDAWHHDLWSMAVDIFCVVLWLILPDNRNKSDDNGDDEPDEPDPTPDGDAVDLWLKEQQRVLI